MIRYAITENEARVLRALGDYPKVNLYEITTLAQLAPKDVVEAARMLTERGLMRFDEADGWLQMTSEGQAVQYMLSPPRFSQMGQRSGPEVSIVSKADAAAESTISQMSEDELDSTLSEEMDKIGSAVGEEYAGLEEKD